MFEKMGVLVYNIWYKWDYRNFEKEDEMFLNIFDSIRDFFKNMFENISFSSLITLLFGIIIGMLICIMAYLIYFLANIKKQEKINKLNKDELKADIKKKGPTAVEIDVEEIEKYINAAKDEYKEASSNMKAGTKIAIARDIGQDLATNVATIFYPKSKHPLAELSIDELIKLDYYIMGRIEKIIDGSILKIFKKGKVSTVLNMMDYKRQLDDNKIVKSAKKMHIGGIASIIKSAINIVNPTYYAKKGSIKVTLKFGLDKIICMIFEIIGEEVAKIYSKNVFVIEDKTDEMIKDINEVIQIKEGEE